MFKVLITGSNLPYKEKEIELLSDLAYIDIRSEETEPLGAQIKDYDVILVDATKITEKDLRKAEKLRGIVEYGVGTDNIDVDAASRIGIPVCNVPDASTIEVAEHALALAIALIREIVVANNMVKQGIWDFNRLSPTRIQGKTAGIVGLGRIGMHLSKLIASLGCQLLGYDPFINKEKVISLGVTPVSLTHLLSSSDIVFLCCPLTPQTKGLIGEEQLKIMKPTAYLVNSSRGALVHEKSLYKALRNRQLRGAASDVLIEEPPSPNNPLLGLESFLCTPHMAWKSEASVLELEIKAAQEARRLLLGERPLNIVNKEIFAQ